LAAGIPLAALAAGLGSYVYDVVNNPSGDTDTGYFDDVALPEEGGTGEIPGGDFGPGGDMGGEPVGPVGPVVPGGPVYPPGPPKGPGGIPPLSPREVKFYLQSGNLPDRFYSGPVLTRGSGKASGKRSSPRAAIVREVMQKMGMKLGAASKYVKEKGLY
jgi:hypothetical protein